MNKEPLKIFYDGGCQVCSLEMGHYRKLDKNGNLEQVNINACSFDPSVHGLEGRNFQKHLHVQLPDGTFRTGVDAFIEIWKRTPGLGPFAKLAQKKWLRPAFDLGYEGFSRIRPFLPRKKEE